jgi:SpoIID/LytB domain protein
MIRVLIIICLSVLLLCSCTTQKAPVDLGSSPTNKPLSETELDEELKRAATEALGDREGAVIVIDPKTGRLRVVVNPRLAFEQAFPPGSAIKPFTALTAMRAGLLDRETRRLCRTRYELEDFAIVCSHPRSPSPFDLAKALAYSCNDYFAQVGERLSEGTFNGVLNSFGFGSRTGASANEAPGSLPRGEWQVRSALGESDSLLVTPIQLMAAYTALVNGGHLYRPQSGNGQDVTPRESTRLNIIPKHRTALIEGMRSVVKYGTAEKAGLGELPSYVFGKTGTSTSSNGFRTQGWFVGFSAESSAAGVPREDQIGLGVLVFLKRAHGSQCAEVAGKIFECGMRNAECGMRNAKEIPLIKSAFYIPHSAFRIPHSVRVRSISEGLTRELPLEEYLVGVLGAESSIEDEFEALKAQAVISRTFALRNPGRHAREGYDFCSTTHCQRFVYSKKGSSSPSRRAVEETVGEVLQGEMGELVDAYFHAACGGVTANIRTLWGVPAPSYLRGVRDDFCATMPHHRWTQTIPAAQLVKALKSDERTDIGPELNSILVRKRDVTGRAELLSLEGARRRIVRGWDFKIIVGRSLGWQMIKSSRFDVSRSGSDFVFRGSGFGHGLGLCQEGAHVMARRGMNYRQILKHYFPKTVASGQWSVARKMVSSFQFPVPRNLGSHNWKLSFWPLTTGHWPLSFWPLATGHWPLSFWPLATGHWPLSFWPLATGHWPLSFWPLATGHWPLSFWPLATDNWQLLSSEHFRASFPREIDGKSVENVLQALEVARTDLLRRLQKASVQLPEPKPFEVVVHATTADFIAATGQSGWAAGVTRGRRIELQPLTLLRKRGILDKSLRHELAHAVIEVLSDGRAPRWLSEGLAIHVAGEGPAMSRIPLKQRLTREELEWKLSRPAPAKVMRELYAAAYREVIAMIRAGGEESVWRLVTKEKKASLV